MLKVGTRVKVVQTLPPLIPSTVGATGVIVAPWPALFQWVVKFDVPVAGFDSCEFFAAELAPLTDPRADEFIADMERFAYVAKTRKEKV